jgi:hypothetical protein
MGENSYVFYWQTTAIKSAVSLRGFLSRRPNGPRAVPTGLKNGVAMRKEVRSEHM